MVKKSRKAFTIAIICALALEFDAVEALMEVEYDKYSYQELNSNCYMEWFKPGRIGGHDVILVCLRQMGGKCAASAAANLRQSFENIRLALLVGICGASPYNPKTSLPPYKHEIILGDVIISDKVIESNPGKQHPGGLRSQRRIKETLGTSAQDMRTHLVGIKTNKAYSLLHQELCKNLESIQTHASNTRWTYPGVSHDRLFESSYGHKHYDRLGKTSVSLCGNCDADMVCNKALSQTCGETGCAGNLIQRKRLQGNKPPKPYAHFGSISSADLVLRSGIHRDLAAQGDGQNEGAVAFEMEAAGIADWLPSVTIKGVADYADSHKNKNWQTYAAATAASCAKALLHNYRDAATEFAETMAPYMTKETVEKSLQPRGPSLCSCICHKVHHFNTPKLLSEYLGAIFVTHSGYSMTRSKCTDAYCKHQAEPDGNLSLYYPAWISDRVIHFQLPHIFSPQRILRIGKVVAAGDDLFKFAANGDVEGLRALFQQKRATPFDVSSKGGRSALRIAVSNNRIEACKFFLRSEADPYLEDHNHTSAFDVAWNKILSKSIDQDDEKNLRRLFSRYQKLDKRGFTNLHKTLLGLNYWDLESELIASSLEAINAQDSEGKTALSWAACRGDSEAVDMLLKYGAEIDLPSKAKRTPLSYAAERGDPRTVQALLSSNANPSQQDVSQQTPLHFVAAYHDSPELLSILLDAGANINARDKNDSTPFIFAALYGRLKSVETLVHQGANIDAVDLHGWSALNFAIYFNNAECLRSLLNIPVNIKHITNDGEALFQFVAEYADEDILQTLLNSPAQLQNAAEFLCSDRKSVSDIVEKRRVSKEWRMLFSRLIASDECHSEELDNSLSKCPTLLNEGT